MVQQQLCTLQQLKDSGFGRPFPRHGLQLLFWFANNCLTCRIVQFVPVMTLVSDCQPENGCYGFHLFGNMEEILPVLRRSRNSRRRYAYFEVGNLNTETQPGSADLPMYVRENYDLEGNYGHDNIDRLVIAYHMRSRVVDVLFVMEHDTATYGRFRRDKIYQITWDLIRVLQSPELDLSSFLTQVGYYGIAQVDAGAIWGQYQNPELVFNVMPNTFSHMTQGNEALRIFPEAFDQTFIVQPASYSRQWEQWLHAYSHSYRQPQPRRPRANWRIHSLDYWNSHDHPASWSGAGRGGSGGWGIGLIRLLLGVGALYVAAKCLSWCIKSWSEYDISKDLQKTELWRTSTIPCGHIMLDYVY